MAHHTALHSSMRLRGDEVFSRPPRGNRDDEEEALLWAALERLPSSHRARHALITLEEGGKEVVDVRRLGPAERRAMLDRLVRSVDQDNERFLLNIRDRIDRYVRACMIRRAFAAV